MPPSGRGPSPQTARVRLLRRATILYFSIVAVGAVVAWRLTDWPIYPVAAALALSLAVLLLRDA